MSRSNDKTGKRFGALMALRAKEYHVDNKYYSRPSAWLCVCDCGRMTVVATWDLTFGIKKSCELCPITEIKK